MSIAMDEAEKKYILPDRHGTPAFDLYWLRDQQQQSYIAGRTAEPTEAEIKAAVRAMYYRHAADWESDADYARSLLEAARKAVTQ